jgi:2-polyprenyl-3-methyl-5-hydroxy-6-metoxy-1,4-benzoquinol methylase
VQQYANRAANLLEVVNDPPSSQVCRKMNRPRLRHSRSEEFDQAQSSVGAGQRSARWSDLAPDPNAAAVLARRAETLRAAWRDPIPDRSVYIVEHCRGKRVLDIGCVAHDVARMSSPSWLHRRIASAADTCLGVDVVEVGVQAMKELGYDAIVHDLGGGPGPLAEESPFDVIVAGELIEHVGSMDMLFETANELLTPAGCLVLTTPNPYAPNRVYAGQRGIVWENVDHILYAFPSGIAELAERHGLVLAEAATTVVPQLIGARQRLKAVKQSIQGRRWLSVGFATHGERIVVRSGSSSPKMPALRPRPSKRFIGETFVYIVRRAGDEVG